MSPFAKATSASPASANGEVRLGANRPSRGERGLKVRPCLLVGAAHDGEQAVHY